MRHVYQDQTIGGADILNSLADVNIGNPEDGQMLVYDASTQRWRNVTQKSLNDLAEVTDLTDIIATGTTNATGATIPKGTFFYLNDDLCQAKADIASGATFTENTNYEEVTAGGLNELNSNMPHKYSKTVSNLNISRTWGSLYYDIVEISTGTKDCRGLRMFASYVQTSGGSAFAYISDVSSSVISVMLVRPVSATTSGNLYVNVYDQ